jgi:hypothetical protein
MLMSLLIMSASKCIDHLAQYRLFINGHVPVNLVTYLCQTKITRSLALSDTVCAWLGNFFSSVSFTKEKQISVPFAFQLIIGGAILDGSEVLVTGFAQ